MALLQIQRLYQRIPSFECIPGCTDCCGPIPFAKSEWERITDKREADSLTCPYANNGCDIHATRPFMCRLFGAADVPRLTCPHGKGPTKKLTAKQAAKLTKAYIREMNKDIVHEFAP